MKRKIGILRGKPIVEGNENVVKKDIEIYYKDLNSGGSSGGSQEFIGCKNEDSSNYRRALNTIKNELQDVQFVTIYSNGSNIEFNGYSKNGEAVYAYCNYDQGASINTQKYDSLDNTSSTYLEKIDDNIYKITNIYSILLITNIVFIPFKWQYQKMGYGTLYKSACYDINKPVFMLDPCIIDVRSNISGCFNTPAFFAKVGNNWLYYDSGDNTSSYSPKKVLEWLLDPNSPDQTNNTALA